MHAIRKIALGLFDNSVMMLPVLNFTKFLVKCVGFKIFHLPLERSLKILFLMVLISKYVKSILIKHEHIEKPVLAQLNSDLTVSSIYYVESYWLVCCVT